MHRILMALSLAVLATFSMAQTSAQTAVLRSINQFVDGFNKGDTKTAVAACADETPSLTNFRRTSME